MQKLPVLPGVWFVDIPKERLRILCGTPMDSIKHLLSLGIIEKLKKDGIDYYSGPNAILLSDLQIQNGSLWNLAEFPILHMMYRQGMALPNHPGFTNNKPLLIGLSEIADRIGRYVIRGFYGLLSMEEMRESGVPNADIDDLWRLKQKFAGGAIKGLEELLDIVPLDHKGGKITKTLSIERCAVNHYRFVTADDELDVDMNIPESKKWYPTYELPHVMPNSMPFSVVHIGEGNGWDLERPCLGSLVTYQGKKYLIDAGPGIQYSIEHLGMSINEIDGVFITHVHDDHFSGFADFSTRDMPIVVYAVQPVLETLRLKCQSLFGDDTDILNQMVDMRSIPVDTWTNIDGLEIMPKWSAHPIETTLFYFRCKNGNSHSIYGHVVDIISKNVLKKHTGKDGVSAAFSKKIFENYSWKCDVKKLDVGRGLIHGHSEDFSDDSSSKIVLAHTERHASENDKKFGMEVGFGDIDVLIPATSSYEEYWIDNHLEHHFPFFGDKEIERLKACQCRVFDPDTKLVEAGEFSKTLFLVLSGSVQRCQENTLTALRFSAGGLIGEEEYLFDDRNGSPHVSQNNVKCLLIPADLYGDLMKSVNYLKKRQYHLEIRRSLSAWNFPGQKVSCPQLDRLSESVESVHFKKNSSILLGANSDDAVYVLCYGSIANTKTGQYILPGEWLNVNKVLSPGQWKASVEWTASVDSKIIKIPGMLIRSIPSLYWALREMISRM